MKRSLGGKPRKVTDEQIRRLREWKTFGQLAREIGICREYAHKLRSRKYQHKQASP